METTYQRLPGTGFPTRYALWTAEDHILSVENTFVAETYRRYYFKDVQALAYCETHSRLRVNAVIGAAASIWLLFAVIVALGVGAGVVGWVLLNVPTALLLTVILVNSVKGATCVCRIQTAGRLEKLPSLGRVGPARLTMDFLQLRVEETQGGSAPSPDQVVANEPPPTPGGPAASHAATGDLAAIQRVDAAWIHITVFSLLLADLLLSGVHIVYVNRPTEALGALIALGVFGFTVTGLVVQRGTTIPQSIRNMLWIVLAYMSIMIVVDLVYGFVMSFGDPFGMPESRPGIEDPVRLILNIIRVVVDTLLAAPGLSMVMSYRQKLRERLTPPAARGESDTEVE